MALFPAKSSLVLSPTRVSTSHVRVSPLPKLIPVFPFSGKSRDTDNFFLKLGAPNSRRHVAAPVKVSPASGGNVSAKSDDPEDGVSLGTLKLPGNVDLERFEILLFQWGNSLFQGSNLPLPVPLKVDKIAGGARLGFITIEDGGTDVPVYIDLLVYPASGNSGPIFRAIRNGRLKDKPAPGESRLMGRLLEALQKSVQIARL